MSLSKCHPEAAFAEGKPAHPALLALLWSAALALCAWPCVGAAIVPLVSEVNASPLLTEAVVTPSASCDHWLKWEMNDLPKARHLKVTFYLEMIWLYVLHGAAEADWKGTMVDRKEAVPLLDHLAEAGLVLTPNVSSERLSSPRSRPFVHAAACPPQWLPASPAGEPAAAAGSASTDAAAALAALTATAATALALALAAALAALATTLTAAATVAAGTALAAAVALAAALATALAALAAAIAALAADTAAAVAFTALAAAWSALAPVATLAVAAAPFSAGVGHTRLGRL
eukprot:scaffold7915_cov62-Phaeocystis_antarctica.AAC.1